MNEKLNKALEEISDAHIAEAAKPKKKLPCMRNRWKESNCPKMRIQQ